MQDAPSGSEQAGQGGSGQVQGPAGNLPGLSGLTDREAFDVTRLKLVDCPNRHRHDWTACPYAHPGERAKRRDPRSYTGIACPSMKQEGKCAKGSSCQLAHSDWEFWLHPTKYHTAMCKNGATCQRRFCFFAHEVTQLRIPFQSAEEYLATIAPGDKATAPASPGPQPAVLQQGQHPSLPNVGTQHHAPDGGSGGHRGGGRGSGGTVASGSKASPAVKGQQQQRHQPERVDANSGGSNSSFLDREAITSGPGSQQQPDGSSGAGVVQVMGQGPAAVQHQPGRGTNAWLSGNLLPGSMEQQPESGSGGQVVVQQGGAAMESAMDLVGVLQRLRGGCSDPMLASLAPARGAAPEARDDSLGIERAVTAPPILDASPALLLRAGGSSIVARSSSHPLSPLTAPGFRLASSQGSFEHLGEVDALAVARCLAQGRAPIGGEGLLPMQPLGWQPLRPHMQPLLPQLPAQSPLAAQVPAQPPLLAHPLLPIQPLSAARPQALPTQQPLQLQPSGAASHATAQALLQLVQQVERVRQVRQSFGQQRPEQPP